MTIEEPGPNHSSDHILDWLEDSVPFFSPFLDETYNSGSINSYQWWDESRDIGQDLINSCVTSLSSPTTTASTVSTRPSNTNRLTPSELTKKRKAPDDTGHKTSQPQQNRGKTQNSQSRQDANKGGEAVEEVVAVKKSVGNKKNSSKTTGNNYNNGSSKEGRWAEQLLNPCAIAIIKGDVTRVHHLLCVLQELASPTGDANHRLAAYGLQALTHHLSSNSSSSTTFVPVTFASADPRFFQRLLIKFHEVSPWFAFPNNMANSSILQILSEEPNRSRNLHILDIGVSHGVQWPTLLEALTRRSGGPPPLVRLTAIAPTVENDQNTETPFSIGPPGDNISSRLLSFAKSLNINLEINRIDNHSLQNLNAQIISKSSDEILIVCAQFRLHQLKHRAPDERTDFLRNLRKMEPKAVILSENNMACSCSNCGNFDTGFTRRIEYLWRFLDSTSSAFKGRESDERRVMEGEAAKALTNQCEMNEEKEKWCERMRVVGFSRKLFGDDTIDSARASMRRYDSNWEMRVEEKDGCVGLWWKGQPVSFCSFWKTGTKPNGG